MDWFVLIFVALCLVAVVKLLRLIRFVNRLRYHGIVAAGTVVGLREDQRGKGRTFLVPCVRFQDLQGGIVEGESQGSRHDNDSFIDSDAYVVYDPEQPIRFLFTDELTLTRTYWQLAGVVFLLLVFVSMLFTATKH